MSNMNLLVYLFICPFNLLYILDAPRYFNNLNKKIINKDIFIYGDNIKNEKYSLHYEEYLYEISKVYYEIILKNNKEIRKKQEDKYDLIFNNNDSNHNGYQLKEVRLEKDKIRLFYEKEENNKVEIKIDKRTNITNYLDLFKKGCIYKLNDEDYNLLKKSTDNSKVMILNSYYIYMYIMFFSLCIYLEKSLFIAFPLLRKYELSVTLFIVFMPLLFFLFFYFYFSTLKILGTYIFLYVLFFLYYMKKRKIKIGDIYIKKMEYAKNNMYRSDKFLANCRLMNMCGTYMCIFAVDFFFFPNHFAKSLYYGNTLMDTGVGACIISSAYSFKKKKFEHVRDYKKIIELKHAILFFLGISRVIAVRLTNYKHNVTEYGVDWNFFLTLFSTFVISNIFFVILKKIKNIFLFSCISIFLFELFIYYFNIHDYLLFDHNRTNIFSSNKEGLFNIIGSVNLFLFSFSVDQFVINNDSIFGSKTENGYNINGKEENEKKQIHLKDAKKYNIKYAHQYSYVLIFSKILNHIYSLKKKYSSVYFNIKLFLISLLFYLLHLILNSFGIYSVRVLCNANYIFIVSSICTFGKAMSYLLELTLLEEININILDKLNDNALLIFLFCNITVGAFNSLFQSLVYPLIFVFIILTLYTFLILIFTYYIPFTRKTKTLNNKNE